MQRFNLCKSTDNRAVEFINDTINRMNVISGAPSQGSRVETGIASQTENGHTIANFNSNRKEQRFYIPKESNWKMLTLSELEN